ncbi:hypothetical protein NM688_g3545 [Phlebia brevispora]|uniref:Uncharacterized protein n=1 Tax=Phlebia brevispora TaxID=194682 RepID=A0ACC1T635_9APHY|nr:hypothetical protein NM688_g3545 [Phlebia brevispora]
MRTLRDLRAMEDKLDKAQADASETIIAFTEENRKVLVKLEREHHLLKEILVCNDCHERAASFILSCSHGFCFSCLDARFSSIHQQFRDLHPEYAPSESMRELIQNIVEHCGEEYLTRLPPNAGSALMRGFFWLCFQQPKYTCRSCSAVITSPPVRSTTLDSVATRLEEFADLEKFRDLQDTSLEAHWDQYFPQHSIVRGMFRQGTPPR